MKTIRHYISQLCFALAVFGLLEAFTGVASAQTDLPSTITAVSGYWTSAEVIGISILLFVVGRRVVRKI